MERGYTDAAPLHKVVEGERVRDGGAEAGKGLEQRDGARIAGVRFKQYGDFAVVAGRVALDKVAGFLPGGPDVALLAVGLEAAVNDW